MRKRERLQHDCYIRNQNLFSLSGVWSVVSNTQSQILQLLLAASQQQQTILYYSELTPSTLGDTDLEERKKLLFEQTRR